MRRLTVLSLGAGVQSTAMALMAARGEIPMPDCAIFADTGWEPAAIYTHLDWLEAQLPYPVMRVSRGNLRTDTLAGVASPSVRVAAIPWHMKKRNGERAMGRRQCSYEYKVVPVQRGVRWLLGGKPTKGACAMWIGISRDEATRMKPSRVGYIVNEFPLIDLRMSRNDCLAWMESRGYPKPAKSSCLGCPFHSDNEWRAIRANPAEWADACEVDAAIRHQPRMDAQQFAHRSCVPLADVDLTTAEDHGQINMFENECEGICGV